VSSGLLERLRFDRALAPAGAALLLWASTQPWFRVPSHWDATQGTWALLTPTSEAGFQDLSGILGVMLLSAWALGQCANLAPALLATVGLMLVGLFPCAVVVHDAEVGGAASWFERTHRSLVWLGGDIALSNGASESLTEEDVLISDQPASFRALPSPQRLTRDEPLSLLAPATEWLGYGNVFAAFARSGWLAAVLGLLLVIVGCAFTADRPRARLGECAAAVIGGLVATTALALIPVFRAARAMDAAERATGMGQPATALTHLEAAATALPLFGEDSHYLAQHGLLSRRAGLADAPTARLYLARVRESQVTPAVAAESLRSVLASDDADVSVRREAARALARVGALALNSGQLAAGRAALEDAQALLAADPKLEAALQLTWLRTGELELLERSAERVAALYETVSLPSGGAVVALALERVARARLAAGDATAAARAAALRGRPE
jgi:hypothetical protein